MSRQATRHAAVVGLRAEHAQEYLRLHTEVWPSVLAQIRRSGIQNYSIFLRDGMLFSYYEYVGEDHEADLQTMGADPQTQRWWELTDPCQRPVDTAGPGELWAPAREVFHAD